MAEAVKIIKEILVGVLLGFLYYIVYIITLPYLITSLMRMPVPGEERLAYYIWFFVALGVGESILKSHPVSIPLRMLSKLLGALFLYTIVNGGELHGAYVTNGYTISVSINISTLIYTVIAASLVYGFIDAFAAFNNLNRYGNLRKSKLA
jgi:hypothetical protein